MKKAFLFPGQGSQIIGMGKDIYEKYTKAKNIYEKASKISRIDIKKLCFEGPEEELNKTANTQIAILTTSLAILEVLKSNGVEADISAGLSLGEYTALIYSEILSFEEGIKLIQKRGQYMQNMLPDEEYSMAAVIGLDSKIIEKICTKMVKDGKFIVPVNYNYRMQTVISGETQAINEAIEKLKEAGARKIVKLKTSGPFHTIKLEKAKKAYEKDLDKAEFNIDFNNMKTKVIKNINGSYYDKNDNIKEILAKHITNPVRFDKTIELMKNEHINEYIEIGPGKTLTGFVRKENKEANVYNINNLESLENYLSLSKTKEEK